MATVGDGLWLQRAKNAINQFTGPGQQGGKSDPISLLIGLVLHTQIRVYQGFTTIWNFGDQQWAYDTVTHDNVLASIYRAGIVGAAWELFEDILTFEKQQIHINDLISDLFQLPESMGQGKKWAGQVFSTTQKGLADVVEQSCQPTRTLLPPFADLVLRKSFLLAPPLHFSAQPLAPCETNYVAAR